LKRTHVAALIAASLAMPAMAFEGPAAFTPSLVGASYPNTAIPATAWKLVGDLSTASGVQIAPQWLITAEHVANSPKVPIGYAFTNAYGSAVVDAKFLAPNAGSFPANVDVALVHLSTAIAVPPNELPLLLSDFVDTYNLPGQLLAAGRGNSVPVRAHWFPANEDGGIAGVKGIDGDSGSGTFWYPTATSRPVLRAVTSGGNNPLTGTQPQTGTNPAAGAFDVRQWILDTIAKVGANAGPGPSWTMSTTQAPLAQRLPNVPESARVNKTSASSAWIEWKAPKTVTPGVPDATSYVIRVSPGGMEYGAGISATTLDIGGLAANTTYTATAQAVNANGPSGRTVALDTVSSINTDRSKFVTSTPPNAFTAFTYEAYTTARNGSLQGCVRMNPTYASSGASATNLGISNYASNLPTLMPVWPSVDYCLLQPGISATIFAAPWNRLSPGPARTITVTPPPAVSGEPLNLTAKGLSITEDGTPYYYFKFQWTPPNQPQPAATLNGYQVAINCTTAAGDGWPGLSFGLPASATIWTVSNVPKGGQCGVILTAQWNRQIPFNSASVSGVPIPAQ
jgi:hypothetical protein